MANAGGTCGVDVAELLMGLDQATVLREVMDLSISRIEVSEASKNSTPER